MMVYTGTYAGKFKMRAEDVIDLNENQFSIMLELCRHAQKWSCQAREMLNAVELYLDYGTTDQYLTWIESFNPWPIEIDTTDLAIMAGHSVYRASRLLTHICVWAVREPETRARELTFIQSMCVDAVAYGSASFGKDPNRAARLECDYQRRVLETFTRTPLRTYQKWYLEMEIERQQKRSDQLNAEYDAAI